MVSNSASAGDLFCTPSLESIKHHHFVFTLRESTKGVHPLPYSLFQAERPGSTKDNSAGWQLHDTCQAPAICQQSRYVRTTEDVAETVVVEERSSGPTGAYQNTYHVDLRTGVGFILASSEKFQIKQSDLYPKGVGQMLIIPFTCTPDIPSDLELPR